MRTLDIPRTIALLKPLTARTDIALRLVGSDERADARIISKSMLRADEHFVALWSERYVAALPPSHPLTLKEKLRAADLAGVPLIAAVSAHGDGPADHGAARVEAMLTDN